MQRDLSLLFKKKKSMSTVRILFPENFLRFIRIYVLCLIIEDCWIAARSTVDL